MTLSKKNQGSGRWKNLVLRKKPEEDRGVEKIWAMFEQAASDKLHKTRRGRA